MAGKKLTPQDIVANKYIKEQLTELKHHSRITQKEIAEKTGIAQPLISQYLSGKSTPTEKNLQKLADFFNVPIQQIDPRYNTEQINQESKPTTINIENLADNVMMFGGRELTDEKKKIIESIIKGYLKEAKD